MIIYIEEKILIIDYYLFIFDRKLQRAKKGINLFLDKINQYYWDFKFHLNS